jgi:3,4-dihydroxy 2-butanone 4-phosphate synthase/GTP cyclohydrolase II
MINNDIAPNILKAFDQSQKQDNKLELREYGVGAQILKNIGIKKIILLSNSNKKIIALDGFDIEIAEQQKI